MAVSKTLQVNLTFPVGTSVSAWQLDAPPVNGGPPAGASIQTVAVASDGTLTFTALNSGYEYVAAAQVSGTWRYVEFDTLTTQSQPLTTPVSGSTTGQAIDAFTGLPLSVLSSSGTSSGALTLQASAAGNVPLTLKGAASQSANLLELRDSSNTLLLSASSSGKLGIRTAPLTNPDLTVAGSIHAGNLATVDRGLTRGLNVIHTRAMVNGDPEDIHGALILGDAQSIGASAPGQVFGAEIQGQTRNANGITPTGLGIVGVNALGLHQSNTTTPFIVGCVAVAQIGDANNVISGGAATVAAAFLADTPTKFGLGGTFTTAAGLYVREQNQATNNHGIYLVSTSTNGGRITWANDARLYRVSAGVLGIDDGLTFGTSAVSNNGVGVITGLTKLCFTKDGNGAPRIFDAGSGLKLHGNSNGVEILSTVSASLFKANDTGLGFQGTTPIAKPTVTGSRGGNAALASLLTALGNYGLVADSSTA